MTDARDHITYPPPIPYPPPPIKLDRDEMWSSRDPTYRSERAAWRAIKRQKKREKRVAARWRITSNGKIAKVGRENQPSERM